MNIVLSHLRNLSIASDFTALQEGIAIIDSCPGVGVRVYQKYTFFENCVAIFISVQI